MQLIRCCELYCCRFVNGWKASDLAALVIPCIVNHWLLGLFGEAPLHNTRYCSQQRRGGTQGDVEKLRFRLFEIMRPSVIIFSMEKKLNV